MKANRPLSGYTHVGIALLLLASACLISAAAYAHHAFGNPEGITYYPNVAFVVRPAVGLALVVAFVAVEQLLQEDCRDIPALIYILHNP